MHTREERLMNLHDELHGHLFADDADTGAEAVLAKYLGGTFTGKWFETIGGRGDAPEVADRFTSADVLAVSMLSVRVPAWTSIELLDRRAEEFTTLLAALPTDCDLHEVDEEHLTAIWAIQDALDTVDGIGHVTRSKLLARKRPRLVPMRDQQVHRARWTRLRCVHPAAARHTLC